MTENKEVTALVNAPGTDVVVMAYYTEALSLQAYAKKRTIAKLDDVKMATDDLSIIAKLKKAMEEKRKEYISPLQDQVKQINETYKTLMFPILEADQTTRGKILAYQKEQDAKRAEQEEINRKRLEAAEAEMRLKGELSESVNLVEVAPEPTKSVATDLGTSGLTDHWKYEILDIAAIPREYLVVDGAMLNAIAKRHHDTKVIPGIRFFNEPIITVRAR